MTLWWYWLCLRKPTYTTKLLHVKKKCGKMCRKRTNTRNGYSRSVGRQTFLKYYLSIIKQQEKRQKIVKNLLFCNLSNCYFIILHLAIKIQRSISLIKHVWSNYNCLLQAFFFYFIKLFRLVGNLNSIMFCIITKLFPQTRDLLKRTRHYCKIIILVTHLKHCLDFAQTVNNYTINKL